MKLGNFGKATPVMLGLTGLTGLLVLVEVLPHTGLVSADYLPPTSRIATARAVERSLLSWHQSVRGEVLSS